MTMSSSQKKKLERSLGRKLVRLADHDCWAFCLSVLQQESASHATSRSIWWGATTSDGDRVVHLAAFAACDSLLEKPLRQYALACLEIILDRDPLSANVVARDGGTPLHAALAAAASSTATGEDDDDDDDTTGVDSDHELSDDEDDEDQSIGSSHDEESLLDPDEDDFEVMEHDALIGTNDSSTSEQLVFRTLQVLLEGGADPNTPLQNNIVPGEEEEELTFARQAVLERWTPLTMALDWVASEGSHLADSHPLILPPDEDRAPILKVALDVCRLLLKAGADPTYPMGAQVEWTLLEFIASSFPIPFSRIPSSFLSQWYQPPNDDDSGGDDSDSPGSLFRVVHSLLMEHRSHIPGVVMKELTPLQAFILAILSDNVNEARDISLTVPSSQIELWRQTVLSDVLPLSHTIWGQGNRMTLLDAATWNRSMDSISFLLEGGLSQDEATTQAMTHLFSKHSRSCIRTPQEHHREEDEIVKQQEVICSMWVDAILSKTEETSEKEGQRQVVLDKLLLQACSQGWGRDAILILIKLGADPNTESAKSMVDGGHTPLHFVAAHSRQSEGMVDALLEAGADPLLQDDYGNRAIWVALKHDHWAVAGRLWDAEARYIHNQDTYYVLGVSTQLAMRLGKAAIACQSLDMMKGAVSTVVSRGSSKEESEEESLCLGKLLLWCIDERSAMGRAASAQKKEHNVEDPSDGVELMHQMVQIITGESDPLDNPTIVPRGMVDEITGQSPLHLLLRTDRGARLRTLLLPTICKVVTVANGTNHNDEAIVPVNYMSLPCQKKFGGYTPLHMACALGCEESIQTLVKYGADISAFDGKGRIPIDLLKRQPTSTTLQLLEIIENTEH